MMKFYDIINKNIFNPFIDYSYLKFLIYSNKEPVNIINYHYLWSDDGLNIDRELKRYLKS